MFRARDEDEKTGMVYTTDSDPLIGTTSLHAIVTRRD